MKKFTGQDLIDMGAELYDNKGFTRHDIYTWLTVLFTNGCVAEGVDKSGVFDLIVGQEDN